MANRKTSRPTPTEENKSPKRAQKAHGRRKVPPAKDRNGHVSREAEPSSRRTKGPGTAEDGVSNAGNNSPEDRAAVLQDAFLRVRERANRGDRRARVVLKTYLDAHPEVWQSLGDMAQHAEMALIDVITQGDWLAAESIRRKAAWLRQQYSRPSQPPLEELAVRRFVACLLQRGKFWLLRQQQAAKMFAAAERSLNLLRGVLPGPGQPTSPAPADTAKHTDSEEMSKMPKMPPDMGCLDDIDSVGGFGVNRIASRINGHGGRLNGFFEPCGHG